MTIKDIIKFKYKVISEEDGSLMPIELDPIFDDNVYFRQIPKRIFLVFGVHNQDDRGKHAHWTNKQILVLIKGKINVFVFDGKDEKTINLEEPGDACYIPNLIWDEQRYLTEDAVLLSICSTHYDKEDYISDFEEFKKIRNEK